MSDTKMQSQDGNERAFRYIAIAIYALVVTFVASRHEPWQDELQAWRIAIDSTNLADLVRNLRYESHPVLWYLLLRAAGWLSRDWAAAVVVNVMIAIATAWLVLRYSPFSRLQRVLVIGGYFFVYEYAVITRSYGLGALLAIGACTTWCAVQPRRWTAAILLVLLANTSAVGLVLAIAMGIGFGFDYWRERAAVVCVNRAESISRQAALVGLAALLIVASVVTQIRPPTNASFQGQGVATAEHPLNFFGNSLATPARAFLPITRTSSDGLPEWGTWRLEPVTRVGIAFADLLGVVILVLGALVVSRRTSALLLWITGYSGLMVFFSFFFSGSLRHHGYLVVTLVTAAWLAFAKESDRWPRRAHAAPEIHRRTARVRRDGVFTLLFLPMLLVSPQMAMADLSEPFAEGKSVADMIRDEALAGVPIIGLSRIQSQAVAALSGRAVYLVHEGKDATFVNHGSLLARRSPEAISEHAERSVRRSLERSCRLLLLSDRRFPPSDWIVRHSRRLKSSSDVQFLQGEGLDVWLVTSPSVASCPAH